MTSKTINDLKIGDTAEFTKTISESDIYLYAGVTGDINPIHINQVYAEQTFFKGRIAHGMLLGGLISAVIAIQLPGPGAIYIKQDLKFLAPARIGDTITAQVEVLEIVEAKNRVKLKTICINQKQELIVDGEAIVSPAKKK